MALPLAASAQSNAMMHASSSDSAFLVKTAQGSIYEQSVAELGLEKGVSPMTRQYAQTLVLDHASFNVDLLGMAHRFDTVVPVTMTSDDQHRLSTLMNDSGAAFDTAFLAEEARINGQDITDETREIDATQNADLKQFVTDLRNGDRFHLSLAQQLQSNPGK